MRSYVNYHCLLGDASIIMPAHDDEHCHNIVGVTCQINDMTGTCFQAKILWAGSHQIIFQDLDRLPKKPDCKYTHQNEWKMRQGPHRSFGTSVQDSTLR